MAYTDYDSAKPLEVNSVNDSGSTISKAQPFILKPQHYSLANTSYNNNSFDFGSATPTDIVFNDDGSKMYMVDDDTDSVYSYSLSTNYDVSTASFLNSFDVSGQEATPSGIAFNGDGTKMFVVGYSNNTVYSYSLSTGFDISTASSTGNSFSVSGEETLTGGLDFSFDGAKMYVIGEDSDSIHEYDLSTGFDLTTASFNQSFDVSGEDVTPTGIRFSEGGTSLVITGDSNNSIFQYELSNGKDISSAEFVNSFDVSTQTGNPQGVAFNEDGSRVNVVAGSEASVFEYTSELGESTTGNGDVVVDPSGISDEQDVAVYDGNNSLLDYEIENVSGFQDGFLSEKVVVWVYNDWTRDDSVQAKVAYGGGITWVLNNSTYSGTSISTQDSSPQDIFWKSDGTKFWEIGSGSDLIYEYDVGTDRQNVTGTWSNTGQNAVMVQHLNGNALDSTSNNNDGTISGATSTSSGEFNGAYSFDGGGDEIDIVSLPASSAFTAVGWANFDTDGSSSANSIYNFIENNDIRLRLNSGTLEYYVKDSGGFILVGSTTSVSTGTNYGTYFRWDGSSTEAFLDTTSVGTDSFSTLAQTGDGAKIGQEPGTNSKPMDGMLDEVRFYSDSKSNNWIQADYDASPKAGQVFFTQQAAESTQQVTTLSLSEGLTASEQFADNFGSLTGQVVLNGSPVQGAYVYAFEQESKKFAGYDVTDANGDYSITGLKDNHSYLVGVDYDDGGALYGEEKQTTFQS